MYFIVSIINTSIDNKKKESNFFLEKENIETYNFDTPYIISNDIIRDMPKSLISDRIIFPSKKQQVSFLSDIKNSKKKSWKKIALEWNINIRTLSDWKNAVRHMPYELAMSSSKKFKIELPKGATRLKWSNHASKAGIKGAEMNLLKNGKIGWDNEKRKEKWRTWWETKGKFKKIKLLQPKEILLPKKSEGLAEFIGIMLGDGGIASYHVIISLNKSEFLYRKFIIKLIKKLFGVNSKIYPRKDCQGVDIVVQRKKLVDFLVRMGLPIGNKVRHRADVPEWIMGSKKYKIACIRGLIDTDGCFFIHKYVSKGKIYNYVKIDFTSTSYPLLLSAYKILISLGFSVRICKNEKAIRIEKQEDVSRYFKIIGTNNLRYGEKLKKYFALERN